MIITQTNTMIKNKVLYQFTLLGTYKSSLFSNGNYFLIAAALCAVTASAVLSNSFGKH